ncbi:MAG: hypothetical protein AB1757_29885 [Acidobacteriota bacterium]
MDKKRLSLIIVVMAISALSGLLSVKIFATQTTQTTSSTPQQPPLKAAVPSGQKWEYRVLSYNLNSFDPNVSAEILQRGINALADQGFEVESLELNAPVAGSDRHQNGVAGQAVVLLKRVRN